MKKIVLYLAMVLGLFFTPAMAKTFSFPSSAMPVYVSGTADGKLIFGSADPTNLDLIDGVVQFCNDVMKASGRGMIKNAWQKAKRINPNLLEVQLFKGTLQTQFAFNVKNGSLWGLIPSCAFIPDGKTIIMELSGPSRDSEDGQGGHHFSLIAHLKDSTAYKEVSMPPCPDESPAVSAIPVSSAVKKPIEEENLAPETVAKKTLAPAVAAATSIPAVKKPRVEKKKKEKCDPCEEIAKVKADTEAIQSSVKAIGAPTSDGETVLGVLRDIQKKVTPPPPPEKKPVPVLAQGEKPALLGKDQKKFFWYLLGLVSFLLLLLIIFSRRSQPAVAPATPNQPADSNLDDEEEAIPLTEPADSADDQDKEPPLFIK